MIDIGAPFRFLAELVGWKRDREKASHTPIGEANTEKEKADEEKEEIDECAKEGSAADLRAKTRFPGP